MTAPPERSGVRRAVVILPGAFTSGSLFFGIWSIVSAAHGELDRAAWFIVVAGVMDMLDGRMARFTNTATAFGAELDSLVDVISFGVAPAMLQFYFRFGRGEWGWLLPFIYVLATALRLARFNIEQAGHAKTQFYGLPCPAAGMTLATLVPFTGTAFFADHLAQLPWPLLTAVLMVLLSLLMVSHVPYPVAPAIGIRTGNGRFGLGMLLLTLAAALYFPRYYFFPLGITFIGFGLVRALIYGFLDRLPEKELAAEFASSDVLEARPAARAAFRNPLRRRHPPAPREEH